MGHGAWPNRWDVLLPAVAATVSAVEILVLRPPGWGLALVLAVLACAVLVDRRRRPLLVAPAAAALVLALPWFGPRLNDLSSPIVVVSIAMYALARWLPDLRGLFGVGLVVLVLGADYVWADSRPHDVSDVFFVAALLTPPFALGRLTRRLAEQQRLLEEREQLVTRAAVRAERDRIAREMHDVIAHTISAMVVQTSAARDLVRRDPERAEQMLDVAADAGRQALTETGRLLHLLRAEDDDADDLGLAPAPGLRDLPHLIDRFRTSGLDVRLDQDGPLPELPAALDVSAYRIVQEALTNALRHSADRSVRLQLHGTATSLSIRAHNAAATATGQPAGGAGLGLVGMAERIAVLGGRLEHGCDGAGRFRLEAVLPVPAS